MKKSILFIAAFCLTSSISFAGGPDEPVLTLPSTNSQLAMMPIFDESVQVQELSNIITIGEDNGCQAYGVNAASAHMAAVGNTIYPDSMISDMMAWNWYAMEYRDMCNAAGGADYILNPVFL